MVDFPGRLATVMFTTGCNFACGYCHNAALAGRRKGMTYERLAELCDRARGNWVDGAVVSGGEPTLHQGLGPLLSFLRERGFAVKLDTNGSRPDVLCAVLPLVDYVAMDVKCAPSAYPGFVGFAHPEKVLESVGLLKHSDVAYEFRTTVIESVHTDEQIDEIAALIRGCRRYVLQPFLPRDDLPDVTLRTTARTSSRRLNEIRERLEPHVDEVLIRGH